MKTFLVTYYFVDGSVYAVRYKTELFEETEEFICELVDKKFVAGNDCYEVINLKNVLRFTIDKLEGDEQ